MKKCILLPALFLAFLSSKAQELSQVAFSGGTTLNYLSLLTDGDVQIRISTDGSIREWGTEVSSYRNNNYYSPKLQPYPGRVEYYGPEADSIARGRVKSIGSAYIMYYGAYEAPYKVGKIRSIGSLQFDYYSNFDNKALQGKIKFIGGLMLDYYSSFENEALVGKLKSVGSTTISYYSSFDDRLIRGKIKSIGSYPYEWYTSVDKVGYGGGLKSGLFRQNIGNVTYILQ